MIRKPDRLCSLSILLYTVFGGSEGLNAKFLLFKEVDFGRTEAKFDLASDKRGVTVEFDYVEGFSVAGFFDKLKEFCASENHNGEMKLRVR